MSGSRAAKRYAKAVLLLATEANLETVVYDDMQSVTATIFGSNELNEMFALVGMSNITTNSLAASITSPNIRSSPPRKLKIKLVLSCTMLHLKMHP